MKKLTKIFFGVVFVVVLLSSLIFSAPATAATQNFSFATRPSDATAICAIGTEMVDFAVAPTNQNTIYAATNDETLKSTDQGRTWFEIHTGPAGGTVVEELVAVAPDDENIVIYANNIGGIPDVKISFNGGLNFYDLNTPTGIGGAVPATHIYDIDISCAYTDLWGATYRVIGAAGERGVGPNAAFYYIRVGTPLASTWTEIITDWVPGADYTATNTSFFACKFSPAYNIDNMVYLLGQNLATDVQLHVACLNIPVAGKMNSGIPGFPGYAPAGTPVVNPGPTQITNQVTKGQLIFNPGYCGVTDVRGVFCSVATVVAADGGSFRLGENASFIPSWAPLQAATSIWSIGLNAAGNYLVSAASHSNVVYMSWIDATWGWLTAANLPIKRIGVSMGVAGVDHMVIAMAMGKSGSEVVLCSKRNYSGAFSLSINGGYTFNDISLVNTDMTTIHDQDIKPDGTERYVVSTGRSSTTAAGPGGGVFAGPGAGDVFMSLFYYGPAEDTSTYYWERVFIRDFKHATQNYIVRASPVDYGNVYLGDTTPGALAGNGNIWYDSTYGRNDWRPRVAPYIPTVLADIEVVNDTQLYVAVNYGGNGYVCPLTFAARWWNASNYIQVFGGAQVASITYIRQADNLDSGMVLAGSAAAGGGGGRVAYTSTGGLTPPSWAIIPPLVGGVATGNVYAEATSTTPGSVVYAVEDTAYGPAGGAPVPTVWGYFIGSGAAAWAAYCPAALDTQATGSAGRSIDLLIAGSGTAQCLYYLCYGDIDSTATVTNRTVLYRAFIDDTILGWLGNATAFDGRSNPPDVLKASADASGILGNQIWFTSVTTTQRYTAAMQSWGFWTGLYPQMIIYTDELAAVAPVLISPINGYIVQVNAETGQAYNAILNWSHAVHGFVLYTYRVQVALDANFIPGTVVMNGIAPVTAPPLIIGPNSPAGAPWTYNYQPGEIYYWRVRCEGPMYSRWSNTFTLNIQAAPIPVPVLYAPANGGVVHTLTPAFSWSPMSGTAIPSGITTVYTFQLATDPTFNAATSLIYTTTATDTTGVELPPGYLIDGDTYYWRVCTQIAPTTNWSATATFTVDLSTEVTTTTTETSTAVPATIAVPSGSASHTDNVVNPSYIWAIIIIGAVLVVAILILIWRIRK